MLGILFIAVDIKNILKLIPKETIAITAAVPIDLFDFCIKINVINIINKT